ncbi:MAG: Maf family protein, partial [Bacteroidales bacterium]|nr:Maf family protein [Bacteroidales bacterium]
MLTDHKITLASASPRRRDLLAGLDIDFTVEPAKDEKETYTDDIPWQEVPEFLARHKSESFHRELEPGEILITADTLVFLPDGEDMRILGKPADREEA